MSSTSSTALERLRRFDLPVRIKITLPYVLLTLLFALAGAYLISRIALESVEDRFTRQLVEMGKVTADWMVQQENRQLEAMRLLANIQGLPEAVTTGNAERLREIALPIAINYQGTIEAIELLNRSGQSVLSLHRRQTGSASDWTASRGETIFGEWAFVQAVLEKRADQSGDKYAGLGRAPWGDYFYVAGPIKDTNGSQVGVLLIGESLSTLVNRIRQDTLAHVTLYDRQGQPIVSTLIGFDPTQHALTPDQAATILKIQEQGSLMRSLVIGSNTYSELIGPWRVRQQTDLALIGSSLIQTFLVRLSQETRVQIFAFVAIGFTLVVIVGIYLANQITNPLLRLTRAAELMEACRFTSDQAAELEMTTGHDEISLLGQVFGRMAREVLLREERLREQVQQLQIQIDETRRATQVAEITETEYFRNLRDRVRQLREKKVL